MRVWLFDARAMECLRPSLSLLQGFKVVSESDGYAAVSCWEIDRSCVAVVCVAWHCSDKREREGDGWMASIMHT